MYEHTLRNNQFGNGVLLYANAVLYTLDKARSHAHTLLQTSQSKKVLSVVAKQLVVGCVPRAPHSHGTSPGPVHEQQQGVLQRGGGDRFKEVNVALEE